MFDDDTTCDFTDEIANSDDPLRMITDAFRETNEADFLGYEQGCAVWVSAA